MPNILETTNPTSPNQAARDLLTVDQAAALLQMSTSSIRAYIRQGSLPAFRIAGKRKVLIARENVMALLRPMEVIDDAALYRNPTALALFRQGLADAKNGAVLPAEDYSQYANVEE